MDYGENIHLGSHAEIYMNCVFRDCNRIGIGDRTGIGPGVHIYTVLHPTDPAARLSGKTPLCGPQTASVVLGRNVRIGGRSVILPGVTIGDGTTVGAGSVGTGSLPAGVAAAGNPCGSSEKL